MKNPVKSETAWGIGGFVLFFVVPLAAVLLAVIVAACQSPGEPVKGTDISRWTDPEYRVVCWTTKVYGGSSISCLPESEILHR